MNLTTEQKLELFQLYNTVCGAATTTLLSDEQRYDTIFSPEVSRRVFSLIDLDYCDPDTSYAEDVAAFYNAFKDYMEQHGQEFKYIIPYKLNTHVVELVYEGGIRRRLSPISYTEFKQRYFVGGDSTVEYKAFLRANDWHLLSEFDLLNDDEPYWIEVDGQRVG